MGRKEEGRQGERERGGGRIRIEGEREGGRGKAGREGGREWEGGTGWKDGEIMGGIPSNSGIFWLSTRGRSSQVTHSLQAVKQAARL